MRSVDGSSQKMYWRTDPDAIDRVVRKHAALGLDHGYSAHSMRATFITTKRRAARRRARAAGHRNPSTTKLYDRLGHNPEQAASFFAAY